MSDELTKLNISLAGVSKFPLEIGVPPNLEYIDNAVRELAAMDNPRVFVIISILKSTTACYFHKHGLYGPDIVLLWPGDGYFTENDFPGVPGCTKAMLAEVLKSVIFFSHGSDFDLGKPVRDSLGMLPSEYNGFLMAKVDKPEEKWSWFFWRRYCYSPIESIAHVLQKVDERLGFVNDTIGNWMASGENFRKDPTFITDILKKELTIFEYEGLPSNTFLGPAGFYQMRESKRSGLQPVPVAAFYPDTQKYEVIAPLKWRTLDGQPPLDRIHYNHIVEPLVPRHSVAILIGLFSPKVYQPFQFLFLFQLYLV